MASIIQVRKGCGIKVVGFSFEISEIVVLQFTGLSPSPNLLIFVQVLLFSFYSGILGGAVLLVIVGVFVDYTLLLLGDSCMKLDIYDYQQLAEVHWREALTTHTGEEPHYTLVTDN